MFKDTRCRSSITWSVEFEIQHVTASVSFFFFPLYYRAPTRNVRRHCKLWKIAAFRAAIAPSETKQSHRSDAERDPLRPDECRPRWPRRNFARPAQLSRINVHVGEKRAPYAYYRFIDNKMVVEGRTRGTAKGIGAMTLLALSLSAAPKATTFYPTLISRQRDRAPIIAKVLLTARSGYYVPQWSGQRNSEWITLRYETSSRINE